MSQVTRKDGQTGFQSLLSKRASMHKWSHLKTLLAHGSNREAAAIVQSFENQMNDDYAYEQFCAE
jgi:hypothetical protein